MTPSPAARSELAPTGKLRVGINYGNFLLVNKDPASGEYRGIAVDLGRELGRRLEVPVDLVAFETAGKLADAAKAGAWDVAFLGNEPQRAGEIAFSPAYLEIEAGYLVPAGSPIRTLAEVDREGVRIAVAAKSAYDLYLSRNLKHAQLVRAQGIDASYEIFVKDRLEVLSGLKPRLTTDAAKLPGPACWRAALPPCSNQWARPRGGLPARNISASSPRTSRPRVSSSRRSPGTRFAEFRLRLRVGLEMHGSGALRCRVDFSDVCVECGREGGRRCAK